MFCFSDSCSLSVTPSSLFSFPCSVSESMSDRQSWLALMELLVKISYFPFQTSLFFQSLSSCGSYWRLFHISATVSLPMQNIKMYHLQKEWYHTFRRHVGLCLPVNRPNLKGFPTPFNKSSASLALSAPANHYLYWVPILVSALRARPHWQPAELTWW